MAPQQKTGWSYRLDSLVNCQVGDGIAVLKNEADEPIRITHVSMITSGGGRALATRQWSFQLMSFRRGTTTGEIAGSFSLTALDNGRLLGSAVGGAIKPVVRSNRWYDVVARLRLAPGHTSAWEIQGIVIKYQLASHFYTSRFPQSIQLPAANRCTRS
jgi:hypothetical protein